MKNKKGFTLLEMIIYIALTSMVLVSLVTISWNIIGARTSAKVSSELLFNGEIVLDNFVDEIHEAFDVTVVDSVFNANPGKLVLDKLDDVTIDTYQKTIQIGGNDVEITKLRIAEGANPAVDLTSDKIDVTNFVLTNLTRGSEKKNIKMQLTLEHIHDDLDPERDKSIDLETSASIKLI